LTFTPCSYTCESIGYACCVAETYVFVYSLYVQLLVHLLNRIIFSSIIWFVTHGSDILMYIKKHW